MKDFELALARVLTQDAKETFEKLDNELADNTDLQLGDQRIEPVVNDPEVRWSLSQWSQFGLAQVNPSSAFQNEPEGLSNQPVEMADLQNLFPAFYASLPDNLNN